MVAGAVSRENSGIVLHGPVSFGARSECTAPGTVPFLKLYLPSHPVVKLARCRDQENRAYRIAERSDAHPLKITAKRRDHSLDQPVVCQSEWLSGLKATIQAHLASSLS